MGVLAEADETMPRDHVSAENQEVDVVVTVGKRNKAGWKRCCKRYITEITAIFVRLVLLAHATLAVWVMESLRKEKISVLCLAVSALMLMECVYTCTKRQGRESKWFCPCFLAYLCTVLPPIWLMELHRLGEFGEKLHNSTELESIQGLQVPLKLENNAWVSITEQTLLFLLIVCRWFLPRGDLTRQELSQLLFVFMGAASDNMGLFELFDETVVRKDKSLTYAILGVWSASLIQFTFVLTATINTRWAVGSAPVETTKKKSLRELLFATEMWALTFSVLIQDGPYVAIRIYVIVKYDLITYSIIFFVCKNLLVISLVFYRLVILFLIKFRKTNRSNDDDDEVCDVLQRTEPDDVSYDGDDQPQLQEMAIPKLKRSKQSQNSVASFKRPIARQSRQSIGSLNRLTARPSQHSIASFKRPRKSQNCVNNCEKPRESQHGITNLEKPRRQSQHSLCNTEKNRQSQHSLANFGKPRRSQRNLANLVKPRRPQHNLANLEEPMQSQQNISNFTEENEEVTAERI